MTTEQKAKAYDEAIERVRKQRADYQKGLDEADKNSQLAEVLRAGICAIDMAFPELVESEDEKFRKYILQVCKECVEANDKGLELSMDTTKKLLAYLEKQKEQKQKCTAYLDLSSNEFEACMLRYLQSAANRKDDLEIMQDTKEYAAQLMEIAKKEQKPVQSDEEREYVRVLKSLISDFIRDNYKTTDITFYQQIYDWLDGRHIEQTPVDYDYEMWKNGEANFEDGKKEVIEHPEKYGLQKAAEWSEEDEAFLKVAIAICNRYSHKDIADWLKSLRPSWKPSEEQMEALQHAIDACESEWGYQDDELRSLLTELKKL